MVYAVKVVWFNDLNNTEEKINSFMFGENYRDVMDNIINQYGEQELLTINIEPFAPDYCIPFEGKNIDLFDEVRVKILNESILW